MVKWLVLIGLTVFTATIFFMLILSMESRADRFKSELRQVIGEQSVGD